MVGKTLKKATLAAIICSVVFTTGCMYSNRTPYTTRTPAPASGIGVTPQRYTDVNKRSTDGVKIKNMSAAAEAAYQYGSAKNWAGAARAVAQLRTGLQGIANVSPNVTGNAYNANNTGMNTAYNAGYNNVGRNVTGYNTAYNNMGYTGYTGTNYNTMNTGTGDAKLRATLDKLQAAVASQNPAQCKLNANQLFKQICGYGTTGNVDPSANINNIKYYCREISMNCDSGNKTAAVNNCNSLVKCWNSAKTSVNSLSPASCAKTQALVDSLYGSCKTGSLAKANKVCGQIVNQSNTMLGTVRGLRI